MRWGIDGYKNGWVAVELGTPLVEVFDDIAAFWAHRGTEARRVLIDIPIGLAESSTRQCDQEARRLLGPRAASVFNPPVRQALSADIYSAASLINKKLTGRKLSKQTWNITPRIREVDHLLRDDQAQSVFLESHPELVLMALGGAPMQHHKRTRLGFLERMEVLRRFEARAVEIVADALEHFDVKEDDVIDALALAIAAQWPDLVSIPEEGAIDGAGLRMAIHFPAPTGRITRLNHAQITIPTGAEDAGRAFYCDVLGLPEIPKPASLAGRGGFWVQVGDMTLHIGTEDGVDRAATKAHLAYEVNDLEYWRARLADHDIKESIQFAGYERFECRDPFGNRIEIIAPQ